MGEVKMNYHICRICGSGFYYSTQPEFRHKSYRHSKTKKHKKALEKAKKKGE
jgi:hypothetical protein